MYIFGIPNGDKFYLVFSKKVKDTTFSKEMIDDSEVELSAAEKYSIGLLSESEFKDSLYVNLSTKSLNNF